MTTPSELCPDVRVTRDRNVFKVLSASTVGKWYRVDGEARAGLMACNCPNYEIAHNYNCPHILKVRAFVACIAMQGIMKMTQAPASEQKTGN
jgi:hypothetical protein